MKKLKILYVTSNPLEYNSSANLRNMAVINGLIQNNCEVSLCYLNLSYKNKYIDKSFPDLAIKKRYYLPQNNIISEKKQENNKIKLKEKIINMIKPLALHIIKRSNIYDFNKIYIKKYNWKIFDETFDYIISSSDPKSAHLLAEKIIKQNKNIASKWIQYWGDPFASDINFKSNYLKRKAKKEEARLLHLADKIVYVSPFTLEYQKQIFKEEQSKMYFVPIPYLTKKIIEQSKNKKYTLGYFGDYFTKNRNIDKLVKYAIKNQDINLIVAGNSDYAIKEEQNITVYNRLPYKEINILENKVDLLVCICNLSGTQIPGKIYHYAATNKPILIILDGEKSKDLKKYFEQYNRYYICNNNIDEIEKIIVQIQKEKKEYLNFDALDCKKISKEIISK